MDLGQESSVHIYVDASFQFMYDLETGFHLKPDFRFYFTVYRNGMGIA